MHGGLPAVLASYEPMRQRLIDEPLQTLNFGGGSHVGPSTARYR
jgi:hypothetical protein